MADKECNACDRLACLAALALIVLGLSLPSLLAGWFFGEAGMLKGGILTILALLEVTDPLPLSPQQVALIREQGLTHVTDPKHRLGIVGPDPDGGLVHVLQSEDFLANLGNRRLGKCAFFFVGKPSRIWTWINVCGRGKSAVGAQVLVLGGDALTKELYRRPLDGSILIPGGYKGAGRFVITRQETEADVAT